MEDFKEEWQFKKCEYADIFAGKVGLFQMATTVRVLACSEPEIGNNEHFCNAAWQACQL